MSSDLSFSILNRRLVAFLDVLGFHSRMERETAHEVVKKYAAFIKKADAHVFNPPNQLEGHAAEPVKNFATSKFVFDSIVLISNPIDDPRNVSNFIFAITLLLEMGWREELPMRGVISIGDYVESDEPNVFVSPVFKELHKAEESLKFSGCYILEPAVERVLLALNGSVISTDKVLRNHPVVFCPTPVMGEESVITEKMRWCLNWCYLMSQEDIEQGLLYLNEEKRDLTSKFINYVAQLPGGERQALGCSPPVYIRMMPSTTQCRLLFTGEDDKPIEPPQGLQLCLDAEL